MAHTCLRKKRAACAYVNQERDYAKDVVWPLAVELNDRYGWGAKLDGRSMRIMFPETESAIQLYGADQKRFQRRMRGKQFDDVAVDEAQDFIFSDLQHLCMRVLFPTIADRQGRMWLGGTPGEVENYFFEVQDKTLPEGFDPATDVIPDEAIRSVRHGQWVVVRGKHLENPWTRAELQGQLNLLRRTNPSILMEPWVQREYFSIWRPDTRKTVIKLHPDLNYLYEWHRQADDRFVLGIDFGFPSPSAYVLLTWNPDRYPFFVYLEAWERESMQVHDHVSAIQEYMHRYPGLRIVGDPSWFGGKDRHSTQSFVEELQQVHGLPVEPASKDDKAFNVERLNSEATMGWLKIVNLDDPQHPEASELAKQWNTLVRLKDGSEGSPRHKHDAALYARRAAAPWAFRAPIIGEDGDSKQRRQMRANRFETLKKRRDSRDRRRSY